MDTVSTEMDTVRTGIRLRQWWAGFIRKDNVCGILALTHGIGFTGDPETA